MIVFQIYLRICSCLACVYRVMDARGKFGEHEKCVRVACFKSSMPLLKCAKIVIERNYVDIGVT